MLRNRFSLLGAIALGVSVLTGLVLALLPCTYATQSSSVSSGDGRTIASRTCSSLLEESGSGVVLWLLVPVAFAALVLLGLVAGRRAVSIVAVSLLGVFCLITGFSIGMFYFPTLALAIAATATWKPSPG